MTEPKRVNRIIITTIALIFVIAVIVAIFFCYNVYSGMNTALDAALADAKVLPENAKGVDVEVDFNFRGSVYDVEFYSDRQKYEYKIDSKGEILIGFRKSEEGSSAQLYSDSSAKGSEKSETVSDISEQHAKQLALSQAKLDESKIFDYDADIETFGGIKIYDIEFKYDGYEYNYYINASNGAVVQYNKERD